MAGMERFTQRARRVLSLAHQEAERAKQSKIDTGHLLLGLIDEEGGVAGRTLRELGVSSEHAHNAVQQISSHNPNFDPNHIEIADEMQHVLEFAVDEARRLGHHYIGTEHILLALVRIEDKAMEVFRKLNITADQVRRQTRRVLNEISSTSAPSSTEQNSNQQISGLKNSILSSRVVQPKSSSRVFIVHGHDNEAKETVARYIENLGLKVVILNEQANRGKTIIEKFESFAEDAAFAVVLLTPDDLGSPKSDPQNTKFRARQNVIYELGFFNGKLGRNRVCALFRTDPKGEIELPSDFLGVVYVPLDEAGVWRIRLAKELKEAGLKIIIENIL